MSEIQKKMPPSEEMRSIGLDMWKTKRRNFKELERESIRDSLTGLYNRAYFDEQFDKTETGSVLILDLDKFKDVNDSCGHPFGDRVLKTVASKLQASVREKDTVARYGGEEFAIILDGDIDGKKVAERAELIRAAIEEIKMECSTENDDGTWEKNDVNPTISIGVAELSEDRSQTLKRADDALYLAKEKGRNRVEMWTKPVTGELNGLRLKKQTSN